MRTYQLKDLKRRPKVRRITRPNMHHFECIFEFEEPDKDDLDFLKIKLEYDSSFPLFTCENVAMQLLNNCTVTDEGEVLLPITFKRAEGTVVKAIIVRNAKDSHMINLGTYIPGFSNEELLNIKIEGPK
jgi:hypothetical protein